MVDPTLRRSPNAFEGWPQDKANEGEVAESVYAALYTLDKANLDAVESSVAERRDFHRREAASWYDPATGVMGTKHAHTRLADKVARDKWIDGEIVTIGGKERKIRGYKQEIKAGLHPFCSPLFRALDGDQYTIDRPLDMGDLTRSKVEYDGVVMSYEAAFIEHQRRWASGRAKLLSFNDRIQIAAEVV